MKEINYKERYEYLLDVLRFAEMLNGEASNFLVDWSISDLEGWPGFKAKMPEDFHRRAND